MALRKTPLVEESGIRKDAVKCVPGLLPTISTRPEKSLGATCLGRLWRVEISVPVKRQTWTFLRLGLRAVTRPPFTFVAFCFVIELSNMPDSRMIGLSARHEHVFCCAGIFAVALYVQCVGRFRAVAVWCTHTIFLTADFSIV